jgi:hypothetical protein
LLGQSQVEVGYLSRHQSTLVELISVLVLLVVSCAVEELSQLSCINEVIQAVLAKLHDLEK